MVLISYIIPAYNARPYLSSCLESIYNINLGEYEREVIVCDDGSTDGTDALLKQLKVEHEDLIVLHQEHAGLSATRNRAILEATGKYLCLVDADDRLLPGAQKFPYECLAKDDIDIYGVDMQLLSRRGKVYPYRRYEPRYNRVFRPARLYMKDRNLMPCACAYLYRREFVTHNGLAFHPGICHEDEEWTMLAFAKAESFVALKVNYYLYIVHPGSITTEADAEKRMTKIRNVLVVIETIDAYLRQHPEQRSYMACKLNYLCVDLLCLLFRQSHTKAFRREIVGRLRELGYFPLRKQKGLKYKVFRWLTKLYWRK